MSTAEHAHVLRECVTHRDHQVTAQQMIAAELDVSSRRSSMSGESGVSGGGGGGGSGGGGGGGGGSGGGGSLGSQLEG